MSHMQLQYDNFVEILSSTTTKLTSGNPIYCNHYQIPVS
jgi:hypothetical protein